MTETLYQVWEDWETHDQLRPCFYLMAYDGPHCWRTVGALDKHEDAVRFKKVAETQGEAVAIAQIRLLQ